MATTPAPSMMAHLPEESSTPLSGGDRKPLVKELATSRQRFNLIGCAPKVRR